MCWYCEFLCIYILAYLNSKYFILVGIISHDKDTRYIIVNTELMIFLELKCYFY